MASPSSSLATLEPQLDAYMEARFTELMNDGFIASRVFPVTPVMKQSGVFGKVVLEEIIKNAGATKRAPGAGYWRNTTQFTTDSYACEEYGIEETIDDREAAMYRSYLDARMFAVDRALLQLMIEAEMRVAALAMDYTTYNGNAALNNSVSTGWVTGGTPRKDVATSKHDFFLNCGFYPNAMIMNQRVFDIIRYNSDVTTAIASSGAGESIKTRMITAQQVAQVFDVDQVLVASAPKNTAAPTAAASIAHVWGDYVMLVKIATTNDMKEPCIGRSFHWAEDGSVYSGRVESYREERARSEVIRVRHDVDEKRLHTKCGFLIQNVTA